MVEGPWAEDTQAEATPSGGRKGTQVEDGPRGWWRTWAEGVWSQALKGTWPAGTEGTWEGNQVKKPFGALGEPI